MFGSSILGINPSELLSLGMLTVVAIGYKMIKPKPKPKPTVEDILTDIKTEIKKIPDSVEITSDKIETVSNKIEHLTSIIKNKK